MSSSSSSSYVVCLISVLSFISSSIAGSTTTFHIPLTKITKNYSSDPLLKLTNQAFASLSRAKHLRHPHKTHSSDPLLVPKSYGGYSISLSFGTPPQTLPFVMDTGSELVWLPCTDHYVCDTCYSETSETFDPKSSSSAEEITCGNSKCSWFHGESLKSVCKDCDSESKSEECSQPCPRYFVAYGSGSTNGSLLVESLNLKDHKIDNLVVGCSDYTSRIPSGIVGFGRSTISLPSQLGITKFAYCLHAQASHDQSTKSTPLILFGGKSDSDDDEDDDDENNDQDIENYTPFVKNPSKPVYYYVELSKVTINGDPIDIPSHYLALRDGGNGGTIVDSGSTFTFMENRIYDLVAKELDKHMEYYRRVGFVETSIGLGRCYAVAHQDVSWPKLGFVFGGGAKMDLDLENTFKFVDDAKSVACLSIVTNTPTPGSDNVSDGPAIILGNTQQHNFYVEFDLKKERLGFKKQDCN